MTTSLLCSLIQMVEYMLVLNMYTQINFVRQKEMVRQAFHIPI